MDSAENKTCFEAFHTAGCKLARGTQYRDHKHDSRSLRSLVLRNSKGLLKDPQRDVKKT
jgi:hypothetical protein